MDNCMMQLVSKPQQFDVMVRCNCTTLRYCMKQQWQCR